MTNALEVQQQLTALVSGGLSLSDFEDWFVLHSWDVRRWGDEPVKELVFSVEGLLSEYSSGDLSRAQLLAGFEQLLPSPQTQPDSRATSVAVSSRVVHDRSA